MSIVSTELTDGWTVTKTVQGPTATRVFIGPTGNDQVPAIGSPFPISILVEGVSVVIVATSITVTKYGGDPTKEKVVVNYSFVPLQPGWQQGAVSVPDLPTSGGLSGESVNVPKENSKFHWDTKDGPVCDQVLHKKIITGSFKIDRRMDHLEPATWSSLAGCVNSGSFTVKNGSFAKELVLFHGVEYNEYRNEKSLRRWKVSFSFSVKWLGDDAGWNHMFDPKTNTFRRIVHEDGSPLYKLVSFGTLFGGAETP